MLHSREADTDYKSDSHHMALLLLDVSGFTKMSVNIGAESTRNATCEFFTSIIDIILEHGGDVLKFLGDAILVGWPTGIAAGNLAQKAIAQEAARCAMQIMSSCNDYRITRDIVLKLHAALAIGAIHTFDVGSNERREFLVGGSILSDLGVMIGEAESGEFVISRAAWSFLPLGSLHESLPSGHVKLIKIGDGKRAKLSRLHWLPRCLVHDVETCDIAKRVRMQYDKLQPDSELYRHLQKFAIDKRSWFSTYVPISCREAVLKEELHVLGEMRCVTTMFLAMDFLIPHLNAGEPAPVQTAFLLVIEAARAHGGEIRQLVLDDKGCVAILAWGLPCAAHGPQNDASKAVRCALHIMNGFKLMQQSGPYDFDPGPHIGIAAGEAYVGLVGAPDRCEYAMVGPSVNLAARLMGKASPGQVLLEETVESNLTLIGMPFVLEGRDPIKAKGYDDPICVFEPLFADMHIVHGTSRSLVEQWDMMSLECQLVGKLAAVMAECPYGGSCDFRLRALMYVIKTLNIGNPEETMKAVIGLQAIHVMRATRGSHRGDPAYAFQSKEVIAFLVGLLPLELTAEVHRCFADWLDRELDVVENLDSKDSDAKRAEMAILHHDLDAKLDYHRRLGGGELEMRVVRRPTHKRTRVSLAPKRQSWFPDGILHLAHICCPRLACFDPDSTSPATPVGLQ